MREVDSFMNVQGSRKKVMSILICMCFMLQIIFRSFCFDSMALPSNTVIGLIFRDGSGYHIRNVSAFLDIDGTLTLPTPRDLGDTNDESYANWSPVLVENSFDNIKNIIRNGGILEIEDYDVSNPHRLATSSIATPSMATTTNSSREDSVIRDGFLPIGNEESQNTNITLYRSNVYFSIGSRVYIERADRRNVIVDSMQQFVSKNGNRNQIFFLAVQPPVEETIADEPDIIVSRTVMGSNIQESRMDEANKSTNIEESRPLETDSRTNVEESRSVYRSTVERDTINEIIGETSNHVENIGAGRSNTLNTVVDSNSSGYSSRNNSSDILEEDDANIQTQTVETTQAIETQTNTRTYIPYGSGNSHNRESVSNVRPRVNINTDTSNNRVNGFINTRTTSVNVEDNNFDASNYSVLVYRNINGKEVLSNAKYSWSLDGESHKANILFDDDGEYRISVVKNGTNSFEEKVNVDSTSPYITITGVENLTANARTVSPVVRYSDVNIDLSKSKVTLTSITDGKSRDLIYKAKKQDDGYILNLDPIYIDDNYILTIAIYDLAGNVTKEQVNFSVNKNGATFKFKPEELVGKYTNKVFTPSIEVWNTDEISIVSATINGTDEPYEFVDGELKFLKSIDKDGKYIFNLEVIDTAGNKSSMKPVEVIFDATKPVSIILGVEDGKSYEGSVNIILSTELPGDFIDSVWLDNKLLNKKEYTVSEEGKVILNIAIEGEHSIKVQAKDLAGNLSDIKEVSFDIKVPNKKLLSTGYIPLAVITLGLALGLGIAFIYKKSKEEE